MVLLPHGYPCSSFAFRHLMAALGDRWRLVAPDYPGFGYSGTPPRSAFAYTFDAYADFLAALSTSSGSTATSSTCTTTARSLGCASRWLPRSGLPP